MFVEWVNQCNSLFMKGKCLHSSPKWYIYCFPLPNIMLNFLKIWWKFQIHIPIFISCSNLALRFGQGISLALGFSNLHFILFQLYWLVLKIFLNAPKQQTLMVTVINYFILYCGYPGSSIHKECACNAGDPGLIPR